VLGRVWRTVAVMLMVSAIAGAAVAFSLGVRFAPRSSCSSSSLSYGSNCPGKSLRKIQVGFKRRHHHRRVQLTLKNKTGIAVTINLSLVVKSKSGTIRRITKTVQLGPGQSLTLKRRFSFVVNAARVKLRVSDSSGNEATIKRQFGSFAGHKKKSRSAVASQ
jgi:hypothetical protein